jgi:beta-lactamase regulating signal transducer with metallopeptidase domain
VTTAYLDYLSGVLIFDLAHRLVYVSVLFVPVWLACRLLGRRLPYLQMTLWLLVFLRALLPVEFSLPFSFREGIAALVPDLFGFVEFRLRLSSWGYAASSPPVSPNFPHLTWMMLIVGVWLAVSGLLLGRLLLGRRYFDRLVRSGKPIVGGEIGVMAERWCSRFGIRRPVQMVAGEARVSPFTIGLWRPKVFLPRNLLQSASPDQVDAVLGHELAHVSRFDDLWVRVQAAVVAVLWIFPPIHYASRQLTRQREIVCDQLAVVRGNLSPRAFGEGLLHVLGEASRHRAPGAIPALVGEAEYFSTRIAGIAEASRSGIRAVGVSMLLALAALIFVVPLGPHGEISEVQARLMQERSARQLVDPRPEFRLPIAGAELGRRFEAIPRGQQVSYRYHTGLDLIAPVGAEIRAIGPGEVVRVQKSPRDSISARTGAYMTVRHGEYLAYYTYLRDIEVEAGDSVESGQLLARLGPVPYSPEGKPTHLHLEITRNGISVDPLLVLGLFD